MKLQNLAFLSAPELSKNTCAWSLLVCSPMKIFLSKHNFVFHYKDLEENKFKKEVREQKYIDSSIAIALIYKFRRQENVFCTTWTQKGRINCLNGSQSQFKVCHFPWIWWYSGNNTLLDFHYNMFHFLSIFIKRLLYYPPIFECPFMEHKPCVTVQEVVECMLSEWLG